MALNFIRSFTSECNIQSESCLFSKIPGEVRSRICLEALSDFEDISREYNGDTCYKRPDYLAPRCLDTAFLRTCQLIYRESWYIPWTTSKHTFWLTADNRRPSPHDPQKAESFQSSLNLLHQQHGYTELDDIRVFAQLWKLENELGFSTVLSLQHFHPRCVTLTIRHHDWWFWEDDSNLKLHSHWISKFRFPNSLQVFRMELETLKRKEIEVDDIAAQMVRHWRFLREDGKVISPEGQRITHSEWSGSSTWANQRWIRDESKPETLEYYITTVTFKCTSTVADESLWGPDALPALRMLPPPKRLLTNLPLVRETELRSAGVPQGTSAEKVQELVLEWRRRRRSRRIPNAVTQQG